MKKAVIFDLDGTLADISHRLHFIKGENKDWKSFNQHCTKDRLKSEIAHLLKLYSTSHTILIVTGRESTYRDETVEWLYKNFIHYHMLYMRQWGDYRSDDVIKKEIYTRQIAPDFMVDVVVDDRDKVVSMWRGLGLTCLQCQKGDY